MEDISSRAQCDAALQGMLHTLELQEHKKICDAIRKLEHCIVDERVAAAAHEEAHLQHAEGSLQVCIEQLTTCLFFKTASIRSVYLAICVFFTFLH